MHFTFVCDCVYFIYLFTWPALVDGPHPAWSRSSLGPAAPAPAPAPTPAAATSPSPVAVAVAVAACRLGKEEYCNG